jgi:hypothetical protein
MGHHVRSTSFWKNYGLALPWTVVIVACFKLIAVTGQFTPSQAQVFTIGIPSMLAIASLICVAAGVKDGRKPHPTSQLKISMYGWAAGIATVCGLSLALPYITAAITKAPLP